MPFPVIRRHFGRMFSCMLRDHGGGTTLRQSDSYRHRPSLINLGLQLWYWRYPWGTLLYQNRKIWRIAATYRSYKIKSCSSSWTNRWCISLSTLLSGYEKLAKVLLDQHQNRCNCVNKGTYTLLLCWKRKQTYILYQTSSSPDSYSKKS